MVEKGKKIDSLVIQVFIDKLGFRHFKTWGTLYAPGNKLTIDQSKLWAFKTQQQSESKDKRQNNSTFEINFQPVPYILRFDWLFKIKDLYYSWTILTEMTQNGPICLEMLDKLFCLKVILTLFPRLILFNRSQKTPCSNKYHP